MTERDVREEFVKISQLKAAIEGKIAIEARNIVPILLDAQRVNSAKQLQELLFQLDAAVQQMNEFFKKDPERIIHLPLSLDQK